MTSGGNSLNYFRWESTYQISRSLNSIKAKYCPLSRVYGGQAWLSPNPRKLRLCCPHSLRSIRPGVTARCPSVRPSVPLIELSSGARLVCCWVPRGQELSTGLWGYAYLTHTMQFAKSVRVSLLLVSTMLQLAWERTVGLHQYYRERKCADTIRLAQCWFPGLAISNAKI